jgi:hypothetical protein
MKKPCEYYLFEFGKWRYSWLNALFRSVESFVSEDHVEDLYV